MSAHTAKRRKLSPPPENVSTQKLCDISSSNGRDAKPSKSIGLTRKAQDDRSGELALASGLYKSSFFKLQLDELLSSSKPNYDKQVSRVQEALHRVKDAIERLCERPPMPAFEAERELRTTHGIVVPFPDPRPSRETRYSVAYAPPTNINVVGSFASRTGTKQTEKYTIDLAVTMPRALFQEKDYVNYRFFHKRAYYIACLAAGLREAQDLGLDVKFATQEGDSLRPVLILEPSSTDSSDLALSRSQIRVITAIEDDLFPISRTLPTKNNVRHGSGENSGNSQPTPFYNSALRSEATVASYHKHIHSTIRQCDSYRDACLLGRIWLQQRGFESSFHLGGFGGFEWALLMSLLLEGGGANGKPILLKSYSCYQLFKATIQFLAGRDLTKPLLFSTAAGVSFPGDGPVVYDGKRGINILYKMTPWSYAFLRHEAGITLKMLNESRDDNFEKVFIVKVNEPMLRFDRIIALPSSDTANILQAIRNQQAIYGVLSKALGDRVKLIHISSRSIEPWSVLGKPSSKKVKERISVGLLMNPENVSRVVDHGPSAEQKEEAASFRSFWGEKAELRRFKDGSILESLVWSDHPSSKSIVFQILSYILRRHFNFVDEDIHYIGDEFEEKLRSYGSGIVSYTSPSFQLIADAFSSLEKSIQDMEGVPLTVRHLAPASPLLRYTALRVQHAPSTPGERVDVVLQFESSARWPDDLAAIQMTKVAFLVKIGDCLESSAVATSCRVGLENETSRILNNAYLDIFHASGVIFRLRIHHDREQTLLERLLKQKGESAQAKQDVAYALAMYKRTFLQSPRLTQAIRTLCTRHPLLSPTVRLVKHWFNCHLFKGHVNDELVELFAVRVFTQSYPWDTPSSVMAGFLRTLHLLSRWDWQQEPLTIDLGGQLDQNAVEVIRTRFAAWRKVDPAMNNVALFVASDIDTDGISWTQYDMPSKVVAARMSSLAKAAVKLMREKGQALDVSDLFHTSLSPYDFILSLRSKALTEILASSSRFKNLQQQVIPDRADKLTVVRAFVCELQACFSPNIIFFHGDEQCDVIAGLWNPHTVKPKNWSLKMTYSTLPVALAKPEMKASEDVYPNQTAILNEISRLGAHLIEGIDVHKEDTESSA
ncbi:rRNA-processing protein UTP22 [Aspergillus thermomutatus]|uniref:U3 small nucleolar RNA-associated protein 22 n=1 Tax=Aspergillus thermomutatus TaxID=41047 RepID=A0A397GTS3_ASPTH|nr:uncharacterized protein CDV56_104822 [Aspergillus thermomutatus]RHZ53068.1 hypothetical protein CDV56_104822 [Aspergillus thermomutatus]